MVSQELHISRKRSPQSYVRAVEMKLKRLDVVQLVALEGAIVVACDLANILCTESIAEISSIKTSSVEAESKNLPTNKLRSRVTIEMKASST